MSGMILSPGARRLPLLIQSEAAECGLACLAMIASFHGFKLDLNEARHRFHISLKGTTLRHVVNFASSIGFSARALRLEPANLDRLQCPAILHLDMNHYVVLKEMKGGEAIIHDPAFGKRRLTAEQLHRRFTGIALELTPGETFQARKGRAPLKFSEIAQVRPMPQGLIAKALILSLMFQILVLAAPFFVQIVIDRAVSQGDAAVLLPLAAGFGVLVLLRAAVGWFRGQILLAFGGLFSARLMTNIVRHMLRLPHGWFENRHVSGLLSRLSSTQPIRDLVTEGLVGIVVDGLMAVLVMIAAILIAPVLAIIVLAGFVCSALLKWWQIGRSIPAEHQFIESSAKAQQEFIETVRGIATVKLFRKEADRESRWGDRHVESVNARYALDAVRERYDVGREVIQSFVLALIVYIGAAQVIEGTTSLGLLIAFITYQRIFADSSSKLLDFAGRFRMLDVHLQRLSDVVHSEPETEDMSGFGEAAHRLSGAVGARDLSFRYGDQEDLVFSGISLDIAPGEFVAITGPSGGGKTTLLKLLVGLLEPTDGRINYDGKSLHTIGLPAVRDQIGVVMQDDVLLSGSLAQNITFFDPRPDLEWMRECARIAAIDDDIAAFPMAYHTLVGDMGTVLSGGQKQRVLLARALYKKPKILFIDEGTSSLDVKKEREVNRNLRSLDMTRIIIAHRKDTIKAADRILLLSRDRLKDIN